jgi:hypothetical protein
MVGAPAPAHPALRDRTVILLLIVSGAAIVVQAALLLFAKAYLYADGPFYFYRLLLTGGPLDIDYGRHFAHLATQWPAAAAVPLGVRRIDTLAFLFGVGLYGPPLVGLACCAWIARHRPEFLLFPIATAVAITSNSSFFVVSESHLLIAVFWPLLFLLTLRPRWSLGIFAVAAVLAFPTLRSYESMVFVGPILAACAIHRALRSDGPVGRAGFAALATYFVAGVVVAAHFIVNPRVPGNRDSFIEATSFYRDYLGQVHWLGLTSLGGLLLVLIAVLVGIPRHWRALLLTAFALTAAAAGLVPLIDPASVSPLLHYRARVLNAYLPPVLALAFLICVRRPPREGGWRFAFAVVAVLSVAQVSWHAVATQEWTRYIALFRSELTTRRGLVPLDRSVLSRQVVDGHPVAAMGWGWTMPTMSVLLAPGGDVQAIVESPGEAWQPFSAADPNQLPDLSRYGVRYHKYKAALDAGP